MKNVFYTLRKKILIGFFSLLFLVGLSAIAQDSDPLCPDPTCCCGPCTGFDWHYDAEIYKCEKAGCNCKKYGN
jgi:hypothetical protein